MSGRILIVDDVPTNRALLKAKLSTAYFDVTTVDSGSNVLEFASRDEPDLILIDLTMADNCGYRLCRRLKRSPDTSHIPVVMITALDKTEQREKGLEAGADDFLSKPFDDLTFVARVRSLMRLKIMYDEMHLRDDTSRELGLNSFLADAPDASEGAGSVLIAGPDLTVGMAWKEALAQNKDLNVEVATHEAQTIEMAKIMGPDLIIIDQALCEAAEDISIISALKAAKNTRQSAVIFVGNAGDEPLAAAALDLGATDYIVAPFDPNELAVRVRSQLRRKQYSDRLSPLQCR